MTGIWLNGPWDAEEHLREADAMLALARSQAIGGPYGDHHCLRCGRPPGHPSVPCAACPDRNRSLRTTGNPVGYLRTERNDKVIPDPAPPPPPPPDIEAETRALLAEPLGLSYDQLRREVPDLPAGACCECRLPRGPDAEAYKCAWCAELAAAKAPPEPGVPDKRRTAAPPAWTLTLIALGMVLLALAAHLAAWLAYPAIACFALVIWRVTRW